MGQSPRYALRFLMEEHTVKKIYEIPGFFVTKLSRDYDWVKLFPASESLVSDIPDGYKKSLNLYLQCTNNISNISQISSIFFSMRVNTSFFQKKIIYHDVKVYICFNRKCIYTFRYF